MVKDGYHGFKPTLRGVGFLLPLYRASAQTIPSREYIRELPLLPMFPRLILFKQICLMKNFASPCTGGTKNKSGFTVARRFVAFHIFSYQGQRSKETERDTVSKILKGLEVHG